MNRTPLEKWIVEDAYLSGNYREELDGYQLQKLKKLQVTGN